MKSMIVLFLIICCVTCYQYLTVYNWQKVRKILSSENVEEKNIIKKHIYNDYKYRSFIRAKEFKLLNKSLTKNVKLNGLVKASLLGLVESINTFDPKSKTNFATHSDKYINRNLLGHTYLVKKNL